MSAKLKYIFYRLKLTKAINYSCPIIDEINADIKEVKFILNKIEGKLEKIRAINAELRIKNNHDYGHDRLTDGE